MDSAAVQAFLDGQVKICRAGYTCLKDYRQNTDDRPVDRYCDGYSGRANESAATIIDRVARSCGISQQVILVLLQKEQSLVSSTAPSSDEYSAAAGQGCPDTAPCDPSTAGFFYQVYYAARQYEIYRLNPTWWGYQAGRWNNILYSPYADRNCGTARVFIENQATAGLYIYTPYTPNAAALNDMYGEGDRCSAHGNRNFWRLFTDWFGSTHAPRNPYGPFGAVDAVIAVPGGFQVSGWAADPETADPIPVHVYVDGVGHATTADAYRPDIAAAYPALGGTHGFSLFVPATSIGVNAVCVYGINFGAGGNSQLDCSRVTAMAGSPVGVFEAATPVDGGISAAGWALDPDSTSPIDVHVYVDGVGTIVTSDLARPDVANASPGYGPTHGFTRTVPAAAGSHMVCVYGINVGLGANVQLGCRAVVVAAVIDGGRVPIGALDAVTANGAVVTASGWAIDPDTALPIRVRVEASGSTTTSTADATRSDVGAAYPAYGTAHGFSTRVSLMAGTHQVCVYAINSGVGGDTSLGCRTITIPIPELGTAPIGVIDAVAVSGLTATVSGWALDTDTTAALSIHIYVGSQSAAYAADKSRPDVGSVYPLQGQNHGFSESVIVPAGTSSVCVYAINNAAGGNTLLGCRTIDVPDHSRPPIGNIEFVGGTAGAIGVSGWALDPDTASSIDVHVYVDGVGRSVRADGSRPDVAAAYPGSGALHGFTVAIAASRGTHTVCVYPINDVPGANTLLGCRSATVP
ncbi:hypothetical protein [uncultured Microbacterium sp.]|uniref:hypothetical protein n=1 Tax=uncultured Microbacterium sp. TaxID=191216 RepID=UPI0035CBD25B